MFLIILICIEMWIKTDMSTNLQKIKARTDEVFPLSNWLIFYTTVSIHILV